MKLFGQRIYGRIRQAVHEHDETYLLLPTIFFDRTTTFAVDAERAALHDTFYIPRRLTHYSVGIAWLSGAIEITIEHKGE